ncbi:MAG: BatD family protein [bacterium]
MMIHGLWLHTLFSLHLTLLAAAPETSSATGTIPAALYPSVETSVDRSEILIGDVFHLTVTVTHGPDVTILERETAAELGQFEIKDINPGSEEKLDGGRLRRTIDYRLSTFFTGEFEIPPLAIHFRTEDGREGSVQTSPMKIKVRSLTPEESENLDIRDIKDPVVLEGPSRAWIIWTALGTLLFIALAAYFIRRYYKNKETPPPVVPPLPPHLQALQELRELRKRQDLIEGRQYKEFSTRVSEILRVYIGRRWRITALEDTTDEVLEELSGVSLPEGVLELFQSFFRQCDLMKFAKHELPASELESLIGVAETIVERTQEERILPPDAAGPAEPESAGVPAAAGMGEA